MLHDEASWLTSRADPVTEDPEWQVVTGLAP
jgi:hypothetical protein